MDPLMFLNKTPIGLDRELPCAVVLASFACCFFDELFEVAATVTHYERLHFCNCSNHLPADHIASDLLASHLLFDQNAAMTTSRFAGFRPSHLKLPASRHSHRNTL